MIEKKLMEITQVKEPIVTGKSYGLGIRHLQVACMSLCTTALFVARSNMGVAVLAMTDHNRTNNGTDIYSWDKRTQSFILSSFFWGYMIMQVPSGLLAKRFGGKPILLFALLANGFLTCLIPVMAKWGGWPLVCMCRVGMGLTQACLFSSLHTLFGVWLPAHERTTYSGLVYGGTSIGTIVGLSVSGVLANTVLGWKMIFYATGAFMSLLAVIWWQMAANNPMEHKLITKFEIDYINSSNTETELKRSLSVPWKCIFLCKGFYAIAIAHISTAILFGTLFVEIPTYLEKGLKMSLDKSASLSALPYFGVFMSSIFSSYICDKLVNSGYLSLNVCRKLFNSIALFGSAGALISLNFVKEGHEMLTMIALTTVQTLSGFTCAGFLVNHLDLSPNYAGVMIAMTNCFANVGSVITPILTSFILQNDPTNVSRWRIVFGLIASLLIISNIIYVVFGVTEKQPWDDPQYLEKLTSHSDELSPVLKTEKIVSEENKKKELNE